MISFFTRRCLPLLLFATLLLSPVGVSARLEPDADTLNRARLLSYVIREQLSRYHYSGKSFDDELSRAAFDLYLNQLDHQKRFLLRKDVERLRPFAERIDDEMRETRIELPLVAGDLLRKRIRQARTLVEELLRDGFDFSREESLETDPEKLRFCRTESELRERWRKILKYQVLIRYLDLEEEAGDAEAAGDSTELRRRAREKVRSRYEDYFSRLLDEDPRDFYSNYFNAVTRAFDPHSNYLPPRTKEDFDISMRGSLEGIGATLRREAGYIKVVRVIPGSAAARQGQLQAEDVILEVAQADGEPVDVTDMDLRDAVSLIRGKKGTEVRLTVRKPDGKRQTIPIVRDVVQIEETFVKATTLQGRDQEPLGYIKIPAFYRDFKKTRNGGDEGRNSTDDVRAALKDLAKSEISGLVLDLRNNGGGALTDAVAIAGLFIKEGPVVQVRDGDGNIKTLTDRDSEILYGGPLVVLVNRFSASASEILAGALQDYSRAVVVGSAHTHGKGTVQAMVNLDRSLSLPNMERYLPLGALKVTIQKFYRISGESTQVRGVEPDIVLPDRFGHLESGEKYADYALPWDTVEATDFETWSLKAERAKLAARSSRRIQNDPDFEEIRTEAERANRRSAQTRQSLNIDQVRRERAEARQNHASASEAGHPAGVPEKDGGQDWEDQLSEDPYVEEALAVLEDLRHPADSLSGGPAGPEGKRQSYSRP